MIERRPTGKPQTVELSVALKGVFRRDLTALTAVRKNRNNHPLRCTDDLCVCDLFIMSAKREADMTEADGSQIVWNISTTEVSFVP